VPACQLLVVCLPATLAELLLTRQLTAALHACLQRSWWLTPLRSLMCVSSGPMTYMLVHTSWVASCAKACTVTSSSRCCFLKFQGFCCGILAFLQCFELYAYHASGYAARW
jgi:hypothetical protein